MNCFLKKHIIFFAVLSFIILAAVKLSVETGDKYREGAGIKELTEYSTWGSKTYHVNRLPQLHKAIIINDFKKIKKLLKKGTNVNQTDKYGYTPLHTALFLYENESCSPYLGYIGILLDNGADVMKKDSSGYTPIDTAKGSLKRYFLTYAKIPELHKYVGTADIEKIRELEKKGMNIEEIDCYGQTPLFYAVIYYNENLKISNMDFQKRYLEIAEYLLKKGAKTDTRDSYGLTPYRWSRSIGKKESSEMAKLLIKHGATE